MAMEIGELVEVSNEIASSDPLNERWVDTWNLICKRQDDRIRDCLRDLYYRALEHYLMTGRAVQLAALSRSFNRRVIGTLTKAGLPSIPIVNLLRSAQLGGLPFCVTMDERNAFYILPGVVEGFYYALVQRNAEIEQGMRIGTVEHLNDLFEIRVGRADGPYLKGRARLLAQSPFHPVVLPDLEPEPMVERPQGLEGQAPIYKGHEPFVTPRLIVPPPRSDTANDLDTDKKIDNVPEGHNDPSTWVYPE